MGNLFGYKTVTICKNATLEEAKTALEADLFRAQQELLGASASRRPVQPSAGCAEEYLPGEDSEDV